MAASLINNAAMNIGVDISVWINVSLYLDIYPWVELQDGMVILFLIFQGISILFSIIAAPVYILTNRVGGFPFLTPSPAFVICRLLMIAILASVKWYLIVFFKLYLITFDCVGSLLLQEGFL